MSPACIQYLCIRNDTRLGEYILSSPTAWLGFTVSHDATLGGRDGLLTVYVNVSTAARLSPGRPTTN